RRARRTEKALARELHERERGPAEQENRPSRHDRRRSRRADLAAEQARGRAGAGAQPRDAVPGRRRQIRRADVFAEADGLSSPPSRVRRRVNFEDGPPVLGFVYKSKLVLSFFSLS